jgi:dTDP-4-dehydrorhamnose 3,5-epimerase
MNFIPTALAGGYEIKFNVHSDNRGWFTRFYSKDLFKSIGLSKEWLQMNHSYTRTKGAIRGMHFQYPPFSEGKMVRCISGAVYDVMVDLRSGSPTFLKWVGVELSPSNQNAVFIPEGFAHGFQTLTEDCELIYLHTAIYNPASEGGLKYDDPYLNIDWPLPVTEISDRDKAHLLIDERFEAVIL